MPVFGGRSLRNLKDAHPDIQRVLRAAILDFDFMVLQSSRTQEEQEADFDKGTTKAHWLQSPHDFHPSYAVDCCPYPINWNNVSTFSDMAHAINGQAKALNIRLTWGGNWPRLRDYPHFELTEWREMVKQETNSQLTS